jgi:hypothetical protein
VLSRFGFGDTISLKPLRAEIADLSGREEADDRDEDLDFDLLSGGSEDFEDALDRATEWAGDTRLQDGECLRASRSMIGGSGGGELTAW